MLQIHPFYIWRAHQVTCCTGYQVYCLFSHRCVRAFARCEVWFAGRDGAGGSHASRWTSTARCSGEHFELPHDPCTSSVPSLLAILGRGEGVLLSGQAARQPPPYVGCRGMVLLAQPVPWCSTGDHTPQGFQLVTCNCWISQRNIHAFWVLLTPWKQLPELSRRQWTERS